MPYLNSKNVPAQKKINLDFLPLKPFHVWNSTWKLGHSCISTMRAQDRKIDFFCPTQQNRPDEDAFMLKCAVILASLRRVCTYRNAANVEKSPANMSELCYTLRSRLKLKLFQKELFYWICHKGCDFGASIWRIFREINFTFCNLHLVSRKFRKMVEKI